MNEWVLTRAAVMGGLILVACGPKTSEDDEPTSSDLAAVAEDNVEHALRGTVKAGGFIADSTTLASSLSTVFSGETCEQVPCSSDGVCPPADCVSDPLTVDDLAESRESMNESIDDLMKTLRDKIFTKENLESEGDGTATYLLGPKALCSEAVSPQTPTPSNGSSSAPAPATDSPYDPDCVDQVNRLQVRLRLSSPSAGNVDVALLLTSEKRNPATLELYSNHVGVVVNLGEIKSTLDALGEDTGSLVSLVGKLDFQIRKNAELDYSFLASVVDDVQVGLENAPGETVTYGIGHSVPTFELRLDGNARKVTGTLDVGPITVNGPLDAFKDLFDPEEPSEPGGVPVPRPTYQGSVSALLAGIEAGVTLDGTADQLTLSHLGLGEQTSTLKVDDATILALDVNPAAGRHFDLGLQKQGSGTVATFLPTLDVSAIVKFAPLASQIADISPALLDNALHLWFDGENPSLSAADDQVRIVSGTFHYSDAYDPSHDLTAPAGSCLASGEAEGTSSGLVVTTCQ